MKEIATATTRFHVVGARPDPGIDLQHYAHVRAIAVGWEMGAVGAAIVTLGGAVYFALQELPIWLLAAWLLLGLSSAYLMWAVGSSLARLKAWARWLTAALVALSIAGTIISAVVSGSVSYVVDLFGLAWNGALLWVVLGSAAEELFDGAPLRSPEPVPYYSSPFFWIPLSVVAVCGVLVFAILVLDVGSSRFP
jgi:hypothetical protein